MASEPKPAQSPLLTVTDLSTEFRTKRGVVKAVKGASFEIRDGEVIGLVGETGSGKSALLRSIIGLVPPPGIVASGRIDFQGENLRAASQRRLREIRGSQIALVPQTPFGSLNPVLRIEAQFHNIVRDHSKGRVSRSASRERARAMLASVGIPDPEQVLSGYAHQLSGGMAQRTVIAMALLLDPRLIIADEPTTGLDVTVQRQVLDTINELVKRKGSAMMLVTHDLGVAANYCDRVMVMYAGQIVEVGLVAEVFGNPGHPYTESLLASIPRRGVELRPPPGGLTEMPTGDEAGCVFRLRCPYVHEVPAEVAPPMRQLANGHAFACHLAEGVSEHAARSN